MNKIYTTKEYETIPNAPTMNYQSNKSKYDYATLVYIDKTYENRRLMFAVEDAEAVLEQFFALPVYETFNVNTRDGVICITKSPVCSLRYHS